MTDDHMMSPRPAVSVRFIVGVLFLSVTGFLVGWAAIFAQEYMRAGRAHQDPTASGLPSNVPVNVAERASQTMDPVINLPVISTTNTSAETNSTNPRAARE